MNSSILIKNIYYMLSYAYQTLNEDGYSSVGTEDFDNIHDLFAAILIKGISTQIKRGLSRDYILEYDALSYPKGKVNFSESIKQQTMTVHRLSCQFDEFSKDILLNRILKTSMLLLLRHGDVKTKNRKALRSLLLYFSGVKEDNLRNINWSSVKYNRTNSGYRLLINICWLLHKGLLQTTDDGAVALSKFIVDEEILHRLFEKFVLEYYKKEHSEYSTTAAFINWDLPEESEKLLLPMMKSDITLCSDIKTLIIDTKFYHSTLQHNQLYGSDSINSANLYQIYTYVKNRDSDKSGNVSGVLLYAKTDEALTPNNEYMIGGNRFGVKTLDLNCEWNMIKKQLDELAERFL